MIGTARNGGGHLDGRAYALTLTVDHSGRVEIQHQAGSDQVTDRRMARVAAEIIDHIGHGPVLEQLGSDEVGVRDLYPLAVLAPPPGRAVMACACGRVLDARDMRRYQPPRDETGPTVGAVIRPIVCPDCASGARP